MTTLIADTRTSSKAVPSFLRSSWLSWTVVFGLCLAAALVGIEAWQMWHVRQASLRSAKLVTESLSESLSQQIENTLKTADTVVATLVQRVEAEGINSEAEQRLYELMTSLASALPAIHEMGVTDKDGNAVIKSLVPHPTGMNYSERDYFRFLKDHDTREAFIGEPVRSKVDGSVNITVSRRINAKDGTFAGVVVTSVSMNFFRKLFETVRRKSGGFIGFVADNGELLASSPNSFGEGELAAQAASSRETLEYRSPDGGSSRIGTSNHLIRYPMTAIVARNSSEVLIEWYGQLRVHGAIVICILIMIATLGYKVDQANRTTRRQALCDGLTGLANRRCFNMTINSEMHRAVRNGRPLSLIMVDVDHFKTFNDVYGHLAGDSCLRAITDTLQKVLRRPGDMAARYGGEEFAILLPETDLTGAVQVVGEIMAAVRMLAIPHESTPFRVVTLSAGVACWAPDQLPETAKSLIEAADIALYEAKASGRNTFSVRSSLEIVASSPLSQRNTVLIDSN
jgi:diguanylate cyclase (GGDEF)-like protein